MMNRLVSLAVLLCLLLPAAGRAAVFIPTAEDLARRTPAQRQHDAQAIARLLKTRIKAGEDSLALDDMRFPAAKTDRYAGFFGTSWPQGKVYYQFDAGVTASQRQLWLFAAGLWSAVSNVSFIARTAQPNYVYVKGDIENWSYVGMLGGQQGIGIANWDYPIIVAHEIGHTLGLIHEHQRPDRDAYITILNANIRSGYGDNFIIFPSTSTVGAYDFDSMMHYGRTAFSANGGNTIEPKPAYAHWLNLIGQRGHVSVLDAAAMAQRYGGRGTLAAPTGVTALPGAQPGEILLSWKAVAGAVDYKIFYEETAEGAPYTPAAAGSPASSARVGDVTSVKIAGLARNKRYYLAVKAATQVLESAYSAAANAVTPRDDDAYEPNDTAATAYDLTGIRHRLLSSVREMGMQKDRDWFKIQVGAGERLIRMLCYFNHLGGRLELRLYDGAARLMAQGNAALDCAFIHAVVPTAGTYYFEVSGAGAGNTYDLWWDAESPRSGACRSLWPLYE